MLRFVAADLRRHWPGVLVIAAIIALAIALGVAVTLGERALRLGSARAAQAFDLVVGAPGSETQLVLSSVFLQPAPLPLVPGGVLAALVADPRVVWAAPVGFGDFHGDRPIVGTTSALVDGLGGIAAGRGFERLGDAVVGARVDMPLGERFHPLHGQAGGPQGMHGAATYTVVGRLAPTGTSWDRAVLVPIEAVWRVHGYGEAGEHAAALDLDAPVRSEALSAPDAPGVPAILVKPRTVVDAYRLRQQYRSERTLAVFPGEVLTRLYATLGDARLVLSMVAAGAQALVAAALLLVVAVHVLQRRRQIGALRAFGAPRLVVFAIVWLETVLIVAVGVAAGFLAGWAGARLLAAHLAGATGVAMPVAFAAADLWRLGLLLAISGAVAILPALLAYRQSPAAALRG